MAPLGLALVSSSLRSLLVSFVAIIIILPIFAGAQIKPADAKPIVLNQALGRVEPFFEKNDGQFDSAALFSGGGRGHSILLERDGLVIWATDHKGAARAGHSVHLKFVGASPAVTVEGEGRLTGISNYFAGSDPKKWITKVSHFAKVVYRQIYPGIDLALYFKDGHLEYDFLVSPGADPSVIRLRSDAGAVSLTADGEVVLSAGGIEIVRSRKPYAYMKGMQAASVPVRYERHGQEYGFAIGDYDRRQLLVIDPALAFSTFIVANCSNGNPVLTCNGDFVGDMTTDASGIYLTGSTSVPTFPSVAGQPPVTPHSVPNGFVVKLDPTGSKILYMTFVGSAAFRSIAVDSSGAAFVIGEGMPGFPTTPGSFNPVVPTCPQIPGASCNYPVALRLSADGSTLLYSTLLMASDPSSVNSANGVSGVAVALDAQGNLYVGGNSLIVAGQGPAVPLKFVTTVGAFQPNPTVPLGWMMKLNPAGSGLVYSTYFPAQIADIAVDTNGSAYVTGGAVPGFPTTTGAFQTTITTTAAAFATKLSPDGGSLVYSTFFGGGMANGIAVDSSGDAVIVGQDPAPPTTSGALCTNSNVEQLGYVAKFNLAGSTLVYSTTLCTPSTATSQELSVALDSSGSAYALGSVEAFTPTGATNFPLLNPIQGYFIQGPVGYTAVKLDSAGNQQWGTIIGTAAAAPNAHPSPLNSRIRVDSTGSVYLLGIDALFPMTANSLQPLFANPELQPVFLAKIVPSLGTAVPAVSSTIETFGTQDIGTSSAPNDVAVGNFGDAAMAATPVVSISPSTDFSQTNTCSTPVSAGQKCDVNVVFTPTARGTRTATLTLSFAGLPDLTVELTGTAQGPVIGLSPTAMTFPAEPVSQSSPIQPLTVSNSGDGALNISNIQTSGDFSQTNTCGGSIAGSSNCVVQVTFTPTGTGKRLGTLTLADNAASSPQTVNLGGFSGQGPALFLSPTSLNFAGQIIGTASSATTVTITSIGTAAATVNNISTSGDFSQTNSCTVSQIQPNGTCTVQITFIPTTSGSRSGVLTITDNTSSSPESIPLTGSATDYTFAVSPSSPSTASIAAGQTANYTLTVAPAGNAAGSLSLICQGAPAGATCTVNPSSIQVNGAAQDINVSVATTARSAAINTPSINSQPFSSVLYVAYLMLFLFLVSFKYRRIRWIPASALVLLLGAGCSGGGGGGGGGKVGTPAGTYKITVAAQGASGSSKTVSLTLNVS